MMETSFWQKKINLVLVALLLTFLLFLPSVILPSCPKGITNDPLPGRCGLYIDNNQNQICDLSENAAAVTSRETFSTAFAWQTLFFLCLLLVAVILAIKASPTLYRYLLLLFSFLFAFFAFKNLCPIAFLQFLLILKDQAVLNLLPFLVFLLTIILTLIFGRIFCGWVCPIGAIQEFVFRLPRWLKRKIPNLTEKIPSILQFLPFFILAIIGFLTVRSGKTIFCQLDPFGYLFACPVSGGGLSSNVILLGTLLVLLLVSLLIFRPFCFLLCPLGAIFSALAEVSVLRIKIKKKLCTDCKLCFKKCPTGSIDRNLQVDQKSCIRCQECLSVCLPKALSYQVENASESKRKKIKSSQKTAN